jgi:hypothetical protein
VSKIGDVPAADINAALAWRAQEGPEPLASRHAPTMLAGFPYSFVTTDGTVYENARLLSQDDTGVWIRYRGARVFIAAHELEGAT